MNILLDRITNRKNRVAATDEFVLKIETIQRRWNYDRCMVMNPLIFL